MPIHEENGAQVPAPPTLDHLLRQRESLCEVIESISSELELRPLLTRIIRHACELLDTTTGSIGLYDQERDLIRIEADHNMPPQNVGRELGPGLGVAGLVLERRRAVILDRYDGLPQMVDPDYSSHAVLGVPIYWRDQLIGTFGVSALPPRRFTANDAEVLTLYARHAAVAIQNARHCQREALRNERLALLAQMGRALAADLDLDALCRNAVQMIHRHLGYPNVGLGLIEPDDPETIVIRHLAGGFERALPYERRIHVGSGIMGAAARERRVQLIQNVARDPRYLPPPVIRGILAELAVPIVHGDEVLGVLNLESSSSFSEDDATGVQIVADHLAVAIRNARLFSETQRLAALEERQRLAREVHDSITQLVFSASLMAQSIAPAWRSDPVQGERLTERVVALTRNALAELRALLHELRPPGLDRGVAEDQEEDELPALVRLRKMGLAEMIRAEARRAIEGRVVGDLDLGEYQEQSAEVEEALYRVMQEATHNVVKHARATWVHVILRCADGRAILRVTDNGIGFDPRAAEAEEGGFGLRSMRERIAALGGSVRVRSCPGGGTEIEANVPARPAR